MIIIHQEHEIYFLQKTVLFILYVNKYISFLKKDGMLFLIGKRYTVVMKAGMHEVNFPDFIYHVNWLRKTNVPVQVH